jgi:3-hydroxyacyl-CoA dehydrogenase
MAGKISVIGPGTMGSGIAQSFLQAGYSVVVVGRSDESIKKGAERIGASMDKAIKKGAMSEQDKQETAFDAQAYHRLF